MERKLVERIHGLEGLALKFVSPSGSGYPDRIILMPGGRIYFAELKAPGEKLRPLQVQRKQQLEQLGFRVFVIDSFEALEVMLNEVRPTRLPSSGR